MKQIIILAWWVFLITQVEASDREVNTSPPSWWYQEREHPLSPEPYIPYSWTEGEKDKEKVKSVDYLKLSHENKPFYEWDKKP